MIVRYKTKEDKRRARLGFYKDDVFIIVHEAIADYDCQLGVEELFASADKFTSYLLANEITDKAAIDFEVEDFDDALKEDGTLFLLLTISFVTLCALRKKNPLAVDVAKALLPKCREYEDFNHLLEAMDEKETKKRMEGWRANLLAYELKSIKNENLNLRMAKDVVHSIIENAEHYSTSTIESLLNPLRDTNDQYGHAFDDDINRLKEKLGIKTTTLLSAEEVVLHKTVKNQAIVNAGGVGFRDESKD